MGFQGNFTEEFSAEVLRRLKMPLKALACELGLSYKTLWNYVNGLYPFPPDLIPKLYKVTKDSRILKFFLHPCGFMLIEDPGGKGRALMEKVVKDIKELWEFLDYDQNKKEE